MTTPADHGIRDALRRADLDWLSTRLDAGTCPPALLRRLIRHEDARLRHLGLVLLAERVASGGASDEDEAAELARMLPVSPVDPPETSLVLARLYARLWPHLPEQSLPSWRTARLPVRVQIAWLRAELLTEPAVIRREPPGELLYQAVRDTDITDARSPDHLVAELADSGDPVLQAEALRLARQGLRAGLLAPGLVRGYAVGLLDAAGADVVVTALRQLAEPWAALQPLPPHRLSSLVTPGPMTTGAAVATTQTPSIAGAPAAPPSETTVADAALDVAARHGHGDLLWQVVEDPDLPPRLRQRGMELLGDLADRDAIGALTAIATQDPLLLAGPLVTCLRGLHRRGHFPDDPHVPDLVGLALANHSLPAGEVATVLFTCRRAMFNLLADAADDDPTWPRRLALLVALHGQGGVAELPIGDTITRVLGSTPAPAPFLDAVRELRHTDAEDTVIALLPTMPAAALEALEAIGGHRTVTALAEGLGLAPDGLTGEIAPHLRAVRGRALEVLWHLAHEPERRRALLAHLDPAALPARVAADLGGPDEHELAVLGSHLAPDDPQAALCRLATHGGPGTLPVIARLLLRVVSELAASWEPDAADTTTPRPGRGQPPPTEPAVPPEVLDAIHALGSRLYRRRKIRPTCLLDAANAQDAGHALVATLALDLLDRPDLSAREQAILLKLLLRAPHPRTRARVHRLLRHRDPHVRKHVIALLARDSTGDDAQALSASLTALTTAPDVRTVRQALLALGHARARWACSAIVACLDHPNMNVKKTAAQVLAHAGTPAAVPALLAWLGRHDNPGLRATLAEALRAVLGDAYAATVLTTAENTENAPTCERLLEALDAALPARSLLALDGQGSPVVPALLALVADGRVRLASGTAADLAAPMARHRIAAPGTAAARQPTAATGSADADVNALATGAWNPSLALGLAGRDPLPHAEHLRRLRPTLADWLHLAATHPAHRSRVLRLTLRLCPAPWTDDELRILARSCRVLADGLADTSGEDRLGLLAVLEAVAPSLPAAGALAIAEAVRALPHAPAPSSSTPSPAPPTPPSPPPPGGAPSTLTLLRRCGAVLVRADLDQALATARLAPHASPTEVAVLREAFGVPERATPPTAEAREWRTALAAAARTPGSLADFRRTDDGPPGSRERLAALIDACSTAGSDVRSALVDWMTDLQPLDAPPWTIGETAGAPAPPPRVVHGDDLDQPRSAARHTRLLAMLESPTPDRRATAARALLASPEPETRLTVLRAFLDGRVTLPVSEDLARPLTTLGEADLRAARIMPDRVISVAMRLAPWDLQPLIPLLLEWWEHGPPGLRPHAERALRHAPADLLAESLRDRLDAGAWGFLDLLTGRTLLRTPELVQTCRRLRTEGRDNLADRLLLVDGPLRGSDAGRRDAAALAALSERAPASPAGPAHRLSRQELLDLARTGAPEHIRRALTRLADDHRGGGPSPDRDTEMRDLISELLRHPRARVRLQAHRTSRMLLDRQTYLRHTLVLLDDPQPDVTRLAIRTLCHAAWEPAIPAVVGKLDHAHPVVRRSAAEGLVGMGASAVPALRHAADHARPDRRHLYTSLLQRISAADTP